MHVLGITIGLCVFVLEGLLILSGAMNRALRVFPLFYSYIIYCFCWLLGMYVVQCLDPHAYPSAYWICYLVSILVEFLVLVEISDQIFQPFPAIRNLGRALTVLISVGLGIFYILPAILWSTDRRTALFDFTLRASATKAIVLVVLFYVARRYDSPLGRNTAGLMLGFSIYVAMNIAMMAGAKAFGESLFAHVLWFMEPLAFALCLLVWTLSLWEYAPAPGRGRMSPAMGSDSEAVAIELIRFNSELTKFLHK